MTYVVPARGKVSFTCPHCGVLAQQDHFSVVDRHLGGSNTYAPSDWLASSICQNCHEACLWINEKLAFPIRGLAPAANEDMPADVRDDYEEAASIASLSPKAAAALLRLAVQKLCVHLGAEGKNINSDIGVLVGRGLPKKVQQSLDIVRIVGNNAVHPGQIEIDGGNNVDRLFLLVNIIVETTISIPKQIDALYSSLPDTTKQAIAKRDGDA